MNDSIKPLILIGNGPSISGFDWGRLDGFDTMAMNGFYKVCESDGFFPSYYYLCRKYEFWGNEPSDFVIENHDKFTSALFVQETPDGLQGYNEFLSLDNAQPIIKVNGSLYPDDALSGIPFGRFYDEDLDNAIGELKKNYTDEQIKYMIDSVGEDPPYELNKEGMKKWILGTTDALTEDDLVKGLRWEPAYHWSKSFYDFWMLGESGGVECVRLASLMGYTTIVMIGFDGKFKIDEKGVVDNSSWGVKDMFNGAEYNINDVTPCGMCKTAKGLAEMNEMQWSKMQQGISLNRIPLEIFNATPDTELQSVPRVDLDFALNQLSLYKDLSKCKPS